MGRPPRFPSGSRPGTLAGSPFRGGTEFQAVSNQAPENQMPPNASASPDDELAAEQAYVDHAYACLERTRNAVTSQRDQTDGGQGGTFQARYERDVIFDNVAQRLDQLNLGDQSLCFGRIDLDPEQLPLEDRMASRFYIGRLAVSDENQDPVIVDWRAPVAEAFYRATGPEPMGLSRRRHFATRGRLILGIDDE